MSIKTIKVRRMSGEVASVEVEDALHFEVSLWSDSEEAMRYELVRAETVGAAKRVARSSLLQGDETVDSARRIQLDEVAVQVLRGAEVRS